MFDISNVQRDTILCKRKDQLGVNNGKYSLMVGSVNGSLLNKTEKILRQYSVQ